MAGPLEWPGASVEPGMTHYADQWEPKGIMVLARSLYDRERTGMRRLLSLCQEHGCTDRAAIARAWSKVRQTRNGEALARYRKGDSLSVAGIPSVTALSWIDQMRMTYGQEWAEMGGRPLTGARKVA